MVMLSFVDETTAGEKSPAWGMEIFSERLTLREIIRRRIFQEVAEHHARTAGAFSGLVRPSDPGRIDPERQYERALAAFRRNGFVVLVGDRQVEDLDTEIALERDTEVTFLKLVPLVGG